MAADRSRIVDGGICRCEAWLPGLRAGVAALVFFVFTPAIVVAQDGRGPSHDGGSWNGYERKGHFAKPSDDRWDHGKGKQDWKHDRYRPIGPDISSGSRQRPYPYHLDYYKMKYGGSYAPYFGNLYGPPTFVGFPFFGGVGTFNPWIGYEGGFNGYPPGGVGYPMGWGPEGYVGPATGHFQGPVDSAGPVFEPGIAPGELLEPSNPSVSD
jgi:hypothetical protein